MILNKFSNNSFRTLLPALSLMLLALSVFCCKKTANINANKAFVNVIHTAYNTGPVTLEFGGVPLFTTPLPFGSSSGTTANPYDTTTAGVEDLQLFQDSVLLLSGNTALQQAAYYSLFVYDTLNQSSLGVLIFQNNQGSRTDTLTYIRYLNFVPGSKIGLKVVYSRDTTGFVKASSRDTVNIGPSFFVGYNPNPAIYKFSTVHIGKNEIYAFTDSANPRFDSSNFRHMGSLQFDSTKNYNVFLQGFADTLSGVNSFQLKSVLIN
jgi:hypothetical protein